MCTGVETLPTERARVGKGSGSRDYLTAIIYLKHSPLRTWKAEKTPGFKKQMSDMATKSQQADQEKKGYIAREEYVKIAGKFLGHDHAAAVFDAMDVKKAGRVTHD